MIKWAILYGARVNMCVFMNSAVHSLVLQRSDRLIDLSLLPLRCKTCECTLGVINTHVSDRCLNEIAQNIIEAFHTKKEAPGCVSTQSILRKNEEQDFIRRGLLS